MMPPHGAWVIEASCKPTHLRQEIAFTTMTHVNNLAGCEGDSQYRQRILVTGGAGFIGSHVVVTLVERYPDYYIINLDKLEYCASLRNLDQIQHRRNYKFIQGDICVPVFMRSIFQREKIDVVLHFAAQSHVGLSFWNSLNFTRTNVYGTHVLINAAYEAGVKKFVHISTDEVYGGNSTVKLKEDASLKPTNPYAASKAAAESIVQCYWEAFKFPVIIARPNNVYGPRQYPEKVIPKFISLLENHKKCYIHGDGSVTRNFLYVADAVEAFDKILHQGEPGEVYNVGTDFRLSVIELAKYLIKKLTNARTDEDVAKFIEYVADRPYNDLRYLMDSSKLHDLGWAPKVKWEEGVEETISWYSRNKEANIWTGVEEALMPHPVGAFCPTTPYHDDNNMVIPHPVTMATGDVVKEDGDVVGLPMLPEYHDVE